VQKKNLRKITSLAEFQRRWEAVDNEPEALGLLYAGRDVVRMQDGEDEVGPTDASSVFNVKVRFYIGVADSEDKVLSPVAQQLIVRYLLHDDMRLSWQGRVDTGHCLIMEFLGTVHEKLRKPPFPKLVEGFLWQCQDKWRALRSSDLHTKSTLKGYRQLSSGYAVTSPLFRAIIAWGCLPQMITDFERSASIFNAREEVVAELRAYLVREGSWSADGETASVLRGVFRRMKSLADLNEADNRREPASRAALLHIYLTRVS
jgi:hypothetical protein